MRLFVAVALPPALVTVLKAWQADCAQALPDPAVRWTAPENTHLTLRFLGETTGEQLRPLRDMLDDVAGAQSPFDLQLGACGTFPEAGSLRVLWLGLLQDDGRQRLVQLQQALETHARDLGFAPEERPYRPHVTQARVGQAATLDATSWRRRKPPSGCVPVQDIHLMRSSRGPSGPVYSTLHSARILA